ncbi:MAG: hypothetical protein OXT67_10075 [Zetaproteobacteria bacterium]|nr:hypothetical protein [Zetaproteobacteria bacterium]
MQKVMPALRKEYKQGGCSSYWKIVLPLFVTMGVNRLMQVIDLLMVKDFGHSAVGAFAVPSHIMFIDSTVAFSIVPLLLKSLAAKESYRQDFERYLQFSIFGGLFLCILSTPLYWLWANVAIEDLQTVVYAKQAILVRSLFIPIRLSQLVTSMTLHAMGAGRHAVTIACLLLFLNVPANVFFRDLLDTGFVGVFLATEALTCLHLVLNLIFITKSHFNPRFQSLFTHPFAILRNVTSLFWEAKHESLRLLSSKIFALVSISLVVYFSKWLPLNLLPLFSFVISFEALLLIPVLANTRATTIYLKKFGYDQSLKRSFFWLGGLGVLLTFMFVGIDRWIFHFFLGELGEVALRWLRGWVWLLPLYLPLSFLCGMLVGKAAAEARLQESNYAENVSTWCVTAPVFLLGLLLHNPWLVWGSFTLGKITNVLLLQRLHPLLSVLNHAR